MKTEFRVGDEVYLCSVQRRPMRVVHITDGRIEVATLENPMIHEFLDGQGRRGGILSPNFVWLEKA